MTTRECFKMLGLAPTATLAKVKVAHRKLAKNCRPEMYEPNTPHHNAATKLNMAYQQLCAYFASLKTPNGKLKKHVVPEANMLSSVDATMKTMGSLRAKMKEMREILPKELRPACDHAFKKLDGLSKELMKVYSLTKKHVVTFELKYLPESPEKARLRRSIADDVAKIKV